MKNYLTLLTFLFYSVFLFTQDYSLTVNQGYGSGVYEAGDTVYIFSRALDNYEVFTHWDLSENDIHIFSDPDEWRMGLIMPAKDVTCSANFSILSSDFLRQENIQTSSIEQPVFTAFQANAKGTVFVFHGTGGRAINWLGPSNDQRWMLIKDLYYRGFNVVIPESQESTEQTDLNGDNKIRWFSYPIDSINNPDYQNMKILLDSFERRGDLDRNRLHGLGMSAGGSYAGTFASTFQAKSGIIYGASSQRALVSTTEVPFLFCIMPFDEIIEQSGIDQAFSNYNTLLSRGICSKYFLNTPYPVYPEYFQRTGLSLTTSNNVFNELGNNNCLDSRNFLTRSLSDIQDAVLNQPANWPIIRSLSGGEQNEIGGLIQVAQGGHKLFANHNQRTIEFMEDPCGEIVTNVEKPSTLEVKLYPNPSLESFQVNLAGNFQVKVFNIQGQVIYQNKGRDQLFINPEHKGLLFVKIEQDKRVALIKVTIHK